MDLTQANPLFHLLSVQKIIEKDEKSHLKIPVISGNKKQMFSSVWLSCAPVQECLCYAVSNHLFYLFQPFYNAHQCTICA